MAFFESFSGLTTTGATTLTGLDTLPKAILFYRQMLQWLGGWGSSYLLWRSCHYSVLGECSFIVLKCLGRLKIIKCDRVLQKRQKPFGLIYVLLTIVCAIALWIAGMDVFDAISHSFSTIAIGGFSTHDASVGYFNSPAINTIIAVFLIISGCNFGLPLCRAYWA
ncbi:Trk system potassium uptake protein trkG [Providencia stuartii]|nr:Trk system potassium uptake protein trkG [Providencia stuartii]